MSRIDEDLEFVPVRIAVLTVSDTRKIDDDNDYPKWKHIGKKNTWVYPSFVKNNECDAEIERLGQVHLVESIGDAMALYDAGKTQQFEEAMKDIDAESVSIVTDVHQNRLEVREKLRSFALEIAPHLSRPERNAFVNQTASAEDLVNTALHTPPSSQQAARAVADFKRTISRKEMDADADIDIRMAARRSNDPSP